MAVTHTSLCVSFQMEKMLQVQSILLCSRCIWVGTLSKYWLLPLHSEQMQLEPHLLTLKEKITELSESPRRKILPISAVKAEEVVTLTPICLSSVYMHRSMTLSWSWSLRNKAVIQIFISKFKFICDMLDDASFHQSVSIHHSFTTVRGKANLHEPVHQVTAKEDASRDLRTTPVCQRNDSPTCSVNLVPSLHDRERQGKTAGNKERHHDR